jgi:3-hydroxyisobutyrate dehydrogenase
MLSISLTRVAERINFIKTAIMKAFLGMGLLGSHFVRAMQQKGETVNVWNRTTAKAKALEAYGAKAFENVSQAVEDADIIHVALKDDVTVDEVLEMASKGFKEGAIIVDHTTTSAKGAIERTVPGGIEDGHTCMHLFLWGLKMH